MKRFLLKWFINVVALMVVVHTVSGITVDKWQTTIIAALFLGLVNAFLKPIIILFTLPINILSLGLFTFIINGFMLYLVSKLIKGFLIVDFWNAFLGAFIISVVSFALNLLINPGNKIHFHSSTTYTRPHEKKYHNAIDVNAEVKDAD